MIKQLPDLDNQVRSILGENEEWKSNWSDGDSDIKKALLEQKDVSQFLNKTDSFYLSDSETS